MAEQAPSRETELQKLLNDERERCHQYKQLYQSLKNQLSEQKQEWVIVRDQLEKAVAKHESAFITKENYIIKLEEQLKNKQKELNQLTEEIKSFDPSKIRDSIIEEATNHYEIKIKDLHLENDKIREQYNNLHIENVVLQCKLQSCESEYSHNLERLELQHLYEIDELKNKIESYKNENVHPDDSLTIELKSAKHEVLQLNSKVKGLLLECDELRAQNENLTLQMNSLMKTHSKQNADNLSIIRSLESDRQKAVMQKEVLEKEVSNFQEVRRMKNNELQAYKREASSLKSQLEECEYKHQLVTSELKVENDRLRSELHMERELLNNEISELKVKLKATYEELHQAQQFIAQKEQELQENSLSSRQNLWKQSNDFHEEKEKLEKHLQDVRTQKDYYVSQMKQEFQMLVQNLEQCSKSKLELEKELVSLREKFEAAVKNSSNAEVLSKQNSEYEKEIQKLREQISRGQENVEIQRNDQQFIFSQSKDQQKDNEREILHLKLSWEQQKLQYHQRLEDLESQLRDFKNISTSEKKELERKIQQYSKAVNKLKQKLEFQKSQNEELENQKEILEQNVPLETYLQVHNKLEELQKRIEEYRMIISCEPHLQTSSSLSTKLLTDIKNLKLRSPFTMTTLDHQALQSKENLQGGSIHSKQHSSIRSKRLSRKTRTKSYQKMTVSLSSSSDLDLENL